MVDGRFGIGRHLPLMVLGLSAVVGFYLGNSVPNSILMAGVASKPVVKTQALKVVRPKTVLVPLQQDERVLMVQATLDDKRQTKLILDTGATYTAISKDLATQLGYDLSKAEKVRITTANGPVTLARIKLKAITLNGYTARDVEATVMPLPSNLPFSGLLGLNFVKQHKLTIDTQAEQLVIEPQRP